MKNADQIAEEFRREALELSGLANQYLTLAMLCDGTHFSIPDEFRATEKERIARMTPEAAAKAVERLERWLQSRPEHREAVSEPLALMRARAVGRGGGRE